MPDNVFDDRYLDVCLQVNEQRDALESITNKNVNVCKTYFSVNQSERNHN